MKYIFQIIKSNMEQLMYPIILLKNTLILIWGTQILRKDNQMEVVLILKHLNNQRVTIGMHRIAHRVKIRENKENKLNLCKIRTQ